MPFYENQPTIYPLYRLLEEVLRGEIQVPRFQRPGSEITWSARQRGDLLDSIHRGYPIGTILLWSTTEPIRTLPKVGGVDIPAPPPGQRLRLILDGHQRLSTLIAILGPGLKNHTDSTERTPEEAWAYDLSDSLADVATTESRSHPRDRFVLRKNDQAEKNEQAEDKLLPLNIALNRVRLNEWLRKRPALSSGEIGRADEVRDRFREYNLPVASLVTESLDEATESFHRINSSGTPMDAFHMVTALSYTREFDPQEAFDQIRDEKLEPVGWGAVRESDMMRICAGLVRHEHRTSRQHPAKLNIRGLAKTLQDHPEMIARTGEALEETAQLLRSFGVHGQGILPYVWQLIVLAIHVGSRDPVRFGPSESQALEKWFWLTTYGGVFAGVNSAVVDRASKAMNDLLEHGSWDAMRRDTNLYVEEPSRFDFRAARARGLVLQMARASDGENLDGVAHRALAHGASAIHTLTPQLGRSKWFNLTIEPDVNQLRNFRTALRNRADKVPSAKDDELLAGIAINKRDVGSVSEILQLRRKRLRAREEEFVKGIGLQWRTTDSY